MKKANVGHPKGLYVLFLTEMWERFSYYGMRAMFVLYMVKCLSLAKEDASQIYGNYTGLVYLTPLLGGYLADRFWGNRRSILLGSAVMALGQFLMFVSACIYTSPTAYWLMFAGLGLLILGNGFFKPNISTMVGDLYAKNDSRRDSAYTIFYMGVNVGAMIAPLWCGFVSNGESPEGFKWSFLSAAVGMLIGGLVFYFFKDRYLHSPEGKPLGVKPEKKPEKKQGEANKRPAWFSAAMAVLCVALFAAFYVGGSDIIGAAIYSVSITIPVMIITDGSLTTIERKRIGVIYAITFFVIFFWAAYEQSGASLTFFADEHRPQHSRMGDACILLPVVQPDFHRAARAGVQHSLGFPPPPRQGACRHNEASHRIGVARRGLSCDCFRCRQSGSGGESKHYVAHDAVFHADSRRALP